MESVNVDTLQTVEEIDEQLNVLEPNQRELKRQMFSDLYPKIVARLNAGVTKKAILDLLATCGLKMHPAKFNKLLAEEGAKAGEYQYAECGEDVQ